MVTTKMVKELRELTGAGIMDCKRALQECNGDLEAAKEYLRKKGLAAAEKKAGRVAAEGLVHAYIHAQGRIGVLIEVNCETDFVAKTDEFRSLVHDLAMQVAAMAPEYLDKDSVPAEVLEREKEILRAQAREEGKPDHIVERIVAGRLDKFFERACLLEQPFIKDDEKKVGDLVKEHIASLGENIVVRRFARFVLGEGVEKGNNDESA